MDEMMLFIKNVRIVEPENVLHASLTSITIEGSHIVAIGEANTKNLQEYDAQGASVSPGWFDMRALIPDPGFEYKDDFVSGLQAAQQGGFTGIAVLPNTHPVIDSKDVVAYVKHRTAHSLVDVCPIGAVTVGNKGKQMAELRDMAAEGAVAFSDGHEPLWHSGILLKVLQYLQPVNGVLMNKAYDKYLSDKGQVHEGINSTLHGFKAIPALSEYLAIQKTLDILRYAGGKIHFSTISTKEAVELIRNAKKEGLNVTADVAAHQLFYNDDVISFLDTNYKVMPPFRTEEHRLALVEGIKDGTIDVIVSDHMPQDVESKRLEFDYAEFGISSLETVFHFLAENFSEELIVEKIALAPRRILGLQIPTIKVGELANLTVFDAKETFDFQVNKMKSKSKNSPLLGSTVKGKVKLVVNKGQYSIL